jgi:hypothetical protein
MEWGSGDLRLLEQYVVFCRPGVAAEPLVRAVLM